MILSVADLLDHPQLSEIVGIGGSADYSRFMKAICIVCLNAQGLVAFLTNYLIDVSSGES